MTAIINGLLGGLRVGSIYALIALGYTLVYGIIRLINFAHGEVIMIGAFTSYLVAKLLGASAWTLVIAVIAAMVVCAIVAVLIEFIAYRPLRKKGSASIITIITAIAMSYLLYSIFNFVQIKGLNLAVLNFPVWFTQSTASQVLITLGLTAVAVILLTWFVNKTKMGTAMRAVSENMMAARLMGINVDTVVSVTFAIGAALAGIGAIAYGFSVPTFDWSLGTVIGIVPFAAAVVGGIGSLPGAVVGGYIIGFVEQLIMVTPLSSYKDAFVYGILIIILLFKPEGLLGKNVSEKV